ncbi:MAG: hypothetical protein KAY37_12720 [Phycisphaerae bacterium]|nr:hypothetical protein [Phycisphaerae bacterium]
MSASQEHDFDPRLLDLHLGHLATAEQAELRRLIADDPALAAQDEALTAVFRALASAQEERVPDGLTARVTARVRSAGPPPRVVRPTDDLTETVEGTRERVIRLGNLRDIVAVAALIVLAIGVGVPGLMHMRERNLRMGCSWNLAQLGHGVQQYATTFNASLPFVGWGGQNSWQPSNDPRLVTIPNRRHIYLLLQQAYVVDPRLFVCPSQGGVPMPIDAIERHNDFIEGRNVSYAYQNMAGLRPSANDNPRLPILADENPLFDDGLPLFDARRLSWGEPAQANSRAHGGAGQNLLTLDGSVIWVKTPFSGIDGDNIWTLIDVTEYTGREGPASPTDSHLLK